VGVYSGKIISEPKYYEHMLHGNNYAVRKYVFTRVISLIRLTVFSQIKQFY